jgi:hypothetical protein
MAIWNQVHNCTERDMCGVLKGVTRRSKREIFSIRLLRLLMIAVS